MLCYRQQSILILAVIARKVRAVRAPDEDVPVANVQPVALMTGDDEEDTTLLRQMARNAETYLRSFSWCGDVLGAYFGGGVGGIFAVFLFNIRPARAEIAAWIWAVVGDIPSAYLPLEDAKSAAEVFKKYIWGMSNWVTLARQGLTGRPEEGVPPVNVPPTPEWADKLEQRLHTLRLVAEPFFDETGEPGRVN